MKNSLFDPLILQSSFVEQGIAGRSPIIGRSGSELWHAFINIGIPLIIILVILFVLRMRYQSKKS